MDITGLTLSQIRAKAGAKGGRKTVRKYGKRYMKKLARWGGHATRSRYQLVPVLINDFAMVHRETRQVVALLSGKPVPADLVIGDAIDPMEWMR